MKMNLLLHSKCFILILILNNLINEIYSLNLYSKEKFSALDMLESSVSEKFTDKSKETMEANIKNTLKSNEKLILFEQKYKNFTNYLENSIINLQFHRKFIEDAINSLEQLLPGSPNEDSLLEIIETNQKKIIDEKNKLKERISRYIKFDKERKNFPSFKEILGTNSFMMSSSQVNKLSSMILPKLTDDDYFLNTKDSLVYSYLMRENDTQKRIDSIDFNLTLSNKTIKTSFEKHFNSYIMKNISKKKEIKKPIVNLTEPKLSFNEDKIEKNDTESKMNKTLVNKNKKVELPIDIMDCLKIDVKKEKEEKSRNHEVNDTENNKKIVLPPDVLECLKNDVEKEKEKLKEIKKEKENEIEKEFLKNKEKEKIIKDIDKNSNGKIEQLVKNNIIPKKNCSLKNTTEFSILHNSHMNKMESNKESSKLSKGLSNKMLDILNADIIGNKGVKLGDDCNKSNLTKIEKNNKMDSIFGLKIDDDDENEVNTNSCNKTKYNITLVYITERQKLNITCKNNTKYPMENSTKPCLCNDCRNKEILKKLYMREMLETKKLKHKLIKIYLERKKKKLKEKANQLKNNPKNKPPLFNKTDFEKIKRIIFHDPNFIQKRYEEIQSDTKEKNFVELKKITNNKKRKFLKKPINNKFNGFNEFQNNFLETSEEKMPIRNIIEAEDVNGIIDPIHDFEMEEFDSKPQPIPIRFLDKIDFPHYGFVGESIIMD